MNTLHCLVQDSGDRLNFGFDDQRPCFQSGDIQPIANQVLQSAAFFEHFTQQLLRIRELSGTNLSLKRFALEPQGRNRSFKLMSNNGDQIALHSFHRDFF